jgi:hypothetical protein
MKIPNVEIRLTPGIIWKPFYGARQLKSGVLASASRHRWQSSISPEIRYVVIRNSDLRTLLTTASRRAIATRPVNLDTDVLRNPSKFEHRILCFGVNEATSVASIRTREPDLGGYKILGKGREKMQGNGMEVEPKLHPHRQTVAYACEPIRSLCGIYRKRNFPTRAVTLRN